MKDAINECIRDWVTNVETTHYLIGSVVGPHPYPMVVRNFQSVIGREAREQMMASAGRLPDYAIACVGGGSNAIGLFHEFIPDEGVKLIGVEAGGLGLETGRHAATLVAGEVGVLHGSNVVSASGRGRPGHRNTQHFGRARLSGGRSRAQLP